MPDCFVIMPITTPGSMVATYANDNAHFEHVLAHLFVPAIESIGYDVIPPKASGAELIHAEIIRNLESADLVLCDMSSLNPNVFFELGIRTALNKPVAMVRDDHTPKIPFDTSMVNCHQYDSRIAPWCLAEEVAELADHLKACINGSNGTNPLWRFFGVASSGTFGGEVGLEEKIDLLLNMTMSKLRHPAATHNLLEWEPPEMPADRRRTTSARG